MNIRSQCTLNECSGLPVRGNGNDGAKCVVGHVMSFFFHMMKDTQLDTSTRTVTMEMMANLATDDCCSSVNYLNLESVTLGY